MRTIQGILREMNEIQKDQESLRKEMDRLKCDVESVSPSFEHHIGDVLMQTEVFINNKAFANKVKEMAKDYFASKYEENNRKLIQLKEKLKTADVDKL